MKFAKEIEQDLVPEWRAKYFDYKAGKKKVKAVARALKNVNGTPKTPGRQLPSNLLANSQQSPIRNHSFPLPEDSIQSTPDRRASGLTSYGSAKPTLRGTKTSSAAFPVGRRSVEEDDIPEEDDGAASPLAVPTRASRHGVREDATVDWDSGGVTNYGSFVASPPMRNSMLGPPALELPDPALPTEEESFARHNRAWRHSHLNPNALTTPLENRPEGKAGDAYQVGQHNTPTRLDSSHLLPKRNIFKPRRTFSAPGERAAPALRPRIMHRLFPSTGVDSPQGDVPLEAYKEFDIHQSEYFKFLDKELDKIESFYKMKETQATDRLQALRAQLHEMRDRRIQEIRIEQMAKVDARREHARNGSHHSGTQKGPGEAYHGYISGAFRWMKPIESAIGVGPAKIGKSSKFLQQHTSPDGIQPQSQYLPGSNHPESWRDFTRRPHPDDVTYRQAKRKLKLAMQEFYRGLELLKSYALLNRTAFRKINKKYDKATRARPTQRYMSEKVNKAWFVQSEVLEGQIVAVEDLYARYFERGNHKVAVGKLRSKGSKAGDYSGSVFRNGLLLAAGAVFGVQGVVYGGEHLFNSDPNIRTDASYLLQVYAGYFLALFLFLLFCLDCKIWTLAKINYPFIFEFDPRHNLDWHQLSEMPCFFFFLLGLCIWLNFQQENSNSMFLYWPVILVGVTALILFFPAPIMYHRSRQWWAYSNFRLLLAGLYPVEFRDFLLGDMYCSQTYSMGNLELFFCLYARGWNAPDQCNSTHSRLLGFFSTLPGIWRALQCLRRYYDTRNAFPHLVNCGKYGFTILFYMTLSIYRVNKTPELRALFITCATINSVYTSIWDLGMDWSLLNYYAPHPFLRNNLGYKRAWVYYLAMFLDPILRFNWIFYAIYSEDVQHSALLSFFVSFSEVCRRGLWTLFRVENEHCTNVGRFRASRDVPLPYELEPPSPTSSEEQHPSAAHDPALLEHVTPQTSYGTTTRPSPAGGATGSSSGRLEAQPSASSLRRRVPPNTPISRGIARVGTFITEAHAQDFERKRRPDPVDASPHHGGRSVGVESSDEEEEEEDEEETALEQTRASRAEGNLDINRAMEDQRDEEVFGAAEEILRRRRGNTGGE